MIAALPMYALPGLEAAHGELWERIGRALRVRGIAAPETLAQPDDLMAHWLSPDLALSQTCSLPFRRHLAGKVHIVGTPDFDLAGLRPGLYRSEIVMRSGMSPGWPNLRFAFNDPGSQSGWVAPLMLAAARGWRWTQGPHSGAHLASLEALRAGEADVAGIDAVTWRLAARAGWTDGLEVVEATPPSPGLPYITARGNDPAAVASALVEAFARLTKPARTALCLRGLARIPEARYRAIPDLPEGPARFRLDPDTLPRRPGMPRPG